MSAKIFARDAVLLAKISELFDGKGWHGQGIPTDDFSLAGLQRVLWTYRMVPAGILSPTGEFVETGERYAVADDDNLPIGNAVGKNWDSPQNSELVELLASAIEGSGYEIVSAGTVDNRTEFFVDAKRTGDPQKTPSGRKLAAFVGLHRGFGGQSKLRVGAHSTVIQCANTTAAFVREINSAKGDAREGISAVKNTGRLTRKETLEGIVKGLRSAYGWQDNFVASMGAAEGIEMGAEKARNAFLGFEVASGARELSVKNCRTVKRVNRLMSLFRKGAGNRGESVADFYNAITDFYSHESAGSVDSAESAEAFLEKQWLSSEFGSGRNVKSDLTKDLFPDGGVATEYVDKLASRGKWLVQQSQPEALKELAAF